MNEYNVTVILQPDINFNGANGRRYLKMQYHADTEEEAKHNVREMLVPLLKSGVELILCTD